MNVKLERLALNFLSQFDKVKYICGIFMHVSAQKMLSDNSDCAKENDF